MYSCWPLTNSPNTLLWNLKQLLGTGDSSFVRAADGGAWPRAWSCSCCSRLSISSSRRRSGWHTMTTSVRWYESKRIFRSGPSPPRTCQHSHFLVCDKSASVWCHYSSISCPSLHWTLLAWLLWPVLTPFCTLTPRLPFWTTEQSIHLWIAYLEALYGKHKSAIIQDE